MTFENRTPESGSAIWFCWITLQMLALWRGDAEGGRDRICVTLTTPDKANICLTQPRCQFDEGVEYHSKIKR